MRISIEVLTPAESILKPAGRARDSPNENPFLESPVAPAGRTARGRGLPRASAAAACARRRSAHLWSPLVRPRQVRPGLFDGLSLSFNFSLFNFGMIKKYLVRCCICCIIVGVAAVALYFVAG